MSHEEETLRRMADALREILHVLRRIEHELRPKQPVQFPTTGVVVKVLSQ
jgi:signal transduction histidine kinase